MNKILIIGTLLFSIGITSCTKPAAPSFKKLHNVKISQAKRDGVKIEAQALYFNPNAMGGKIVSTDIVVAINDISVGKLNQSASTEIPKQSEFNIPIAITFNPKKVMAENDGFLQQALKSFFKNEMEVKYDGTATMEILNIPFKVPVHYVDTVKLNLLN
jgi:LEA14-like dessication related protein